MNRNPFETGHEAVKKFMENWNYPNKVNFVADAAFGSTELLHFMKENVIIIL
jgi:hypothetical protein